MDRRPTLEARPPVLINAVVRALIPPACREHVVGDLWERYRSPIQFVLDAARTVPFVMASQIRRTSTIGATIMQAFLMFVAFASSSGGLGPSVAPVVMGTMGLVLRDAYKTGVSISARQVGVDLIAGAGGVLISQAILAATLPHLLLPMPGNAGGLVSFGLLFLLRLQNPTLGAIPRQAVTHVPTTLDALMTEVRMYEQMSARARRIEALVGVVVAAFFILPLVSSPNWFLRIGWALLSAYGLYVAAFVSWKRARLMPEGLGFGESLRTIVAELIRQHGWLRTMWLWYVLPFSPGVVFVIVGGAVAASERGRPMWPALVMAAIVAGVGLIVHRGSQDMAQKLQVRIDTLAAVGERSMRRRLALITLGALLSSLTAFAQSAPPAVVAGDTEIRKILAERVDTYHQSVGIVVGVIEPAGRRIVTYGRASTGGPMPLDGDTVFEIGSMSKVFTSLLLADAVQRGEVALTDPITKYLPSSVKVPERGRPITLQDLSTHTSGLPRLPDMNPKDPENPYADYSVDQLYRFLSTYQLPRDVGASYEYSNLGAGLLGHILALRAGMDYESLVKARITGPLDMSSTTVTLTPALRGRFAPGHDRLLKPVKGWDLPTLAGAGALRSSANDMLTFLAAEIGYRQSPLAPAMKAMLQPRQPAGAPGLEIALAWHVFTANGRTIFWHNGGTGGYRTFMGFDPDARTGVVVLANASSPAGPDDIGRHLLDPKSALLAAGSPALAQPKARTEITLPVATFDRYVGRYQFAPAAFLIVTRDGNRFMAQLTGQAAYEVFAESEKDFFYKIVDAQLTFETDPQGKATAVILHQNGLNQRAPRIEGEPVVPKEVALDPKVLEGYVGRFDFVPGVSITITRQEARLFAQITGQPSVEVFASGPRDFFYKVVDAQLTFEVGPDGRATAVILHQLGRDQRAARGN